MSTQDINKRNNPKYLNKGTNSSFNSLHHISISTVCLHFFFLKAFFSWDVFSDNHWVNDPLTCLRIVLSKWKTKSVPITSSPLNSLLKNILTIKAILSRSIKRMKNPNFQCHLTRKRLEMPLGKVISISNSQCSPGLVVSKSFGENF